MIENQEEIRLARDLVRLLTETDDKIYLHKEARRAYDAIIEYYEKNSIVVFSIEEQ